MILSRCPHLDGVYTSMSFGCSFSAIPSISSILCGSTRGRTEVVFLLECRDYISPHFEACHLSRSGLEEYEVILARAGIFDTPKEKLRAVRVCPHHCFDLGRFWRPIRSCQHPAHTESSRKIKSREVIGLSLAKEIHQIYGCTVAIGSRE